MMDTGSYALTSKAVNSQVGVCFQHVRSIGGVTRQYYREEYALSLRLFQV
jgi:hypothetical protein